MKRDDTVFLFTLIDFLVQVLFFGLAFYTVISFASYKAGSSDAVKVDPKTARTITDWTWSTALPSLAESLAEYKKPHDDFLAKWAPFISSHDFQNVVLDFELVEKHGGRDRIGKAIRALGKPSCLAQDEATNSASSIAELILTDEQIVVQSATQDFVTLAKPLGVDVSNGMVFSLSQFRTAFQRVVTGHPNCAYFIGIHEDTKLVAPRNAVASGFNLIVRK